MKIKDFLENFEGDIVIKIYDTHDFSTHKYMHTQEAITAYGYFTVRSWNIIDNAIRITIRSQF